MHRRVPRRDHPARSAIGCCDACGRQQTLAGRQGASKRPDVADDTHLSQVEFRFAARKSKLAAMASPDRATESRRASVPAKVEYPFLIVKRDFGFTRTRLRGSSRTSTT
jgi:IS5 family transposase